MPIRHLRFTAPRLAIPASIAAVVLAAEAYLARLAVGLVTEWNEGRTGADVRREVVVAWAVLNVLLLPPIVAIVPTVRDALGERTAGTGSTVLAGRTSPLRKAVPRAGTAPGRPPTPPTRTRMACRPSSGRPTLVGGVG